MNSTNLQSFVEYANLKGVPLRVAFKSETWWMKLIAFFLKPVNPKFLTDYITTIGSTIYYPSPGYVHDNADSAFRVACHEFVHAWDSIQKGGFWFSFSYLFPQILFVLAPFGFLAFVWKWFALLFLFALALIPWPAPWRTKAEQRGYAMTMYVDYWTSGALPIESDTHRREFFEDQFLGWFYYRMQWSQAAFVRWYGLTIASMIVVCPLWIQRGSDPPVGPDAPYGLVYEFFNTRGLLSLAFKAKARTL